MPPQIAAIVFVAGILGLFLLDRDPKSKVSPALWIPVVWLTIGTSRMVSQWIGVAPTMESPDQYVEGSPLDRLVFTGLLAAGLIILAARGGRAKAFLRANGPLLAFFLFAGISVMWSDYPFVAFKRWTKAVGNLVMVLVVLTDGNPLAAAKRLLARPGFLLIPLSVLFIQYYPGLGRVYNQWTGQPLYTGVAMGKNGLGVVCLVFGLASVWRLLEAFRSEERPRPTGSLIAHCVVLLMALWLFGKADSVTSLACFLIGSGLIAATRLSGLTSKPMVIHILVAGIICLGLFGLFFDSDAGLVGAMGRDMTLTGRTELWAQVLEIRGNPWVGTGFESFWLGERAEHFWDDLGYYWRPNQSHNGYLEIFLTLGWAGVAMLALVMGWGYRNVVRSLRGDPDLGQLRLAFFVVAVLYNLTEAAFKATNPVWITFLLAITVVPGRAEGSKL